MNETTTLGLVFAAVGSVLLALLGIVWAMLTGRIASVEKTTDGLVQQNTSQETAIGRLIERMTAREEAHAAHREDTSTAIGRLESGIAELGRKIDRLAGSGTPFPGRYPKPGDSGERR